MTEDEWLAGEKPEAVVDWVVANAGARRLRLLGCACLRRRWDELPEVSRGAILVAERFADGGAVDAELLAAETAATVAAEAASDPALGEPIWDAVSVAATDPGSFAYRLLLETECYDFNVSPRHRIPGGAGS